MAFGPSVTLQLQVNGANTTKYNGVTYTGAKTITFSGPGNAPNGATPTYPTSVTFASGTATLPANSITLRKAETTTLTAADNSGSPTITGTSGNFTVSPAVAANLLLAAATTTPGAGAANNLTITARDAFGNTAMSYAGSKNLTFSGGAIAPDGTTRPTVTNSAGTAVNFGSTTAITFVAGVATVSGSNNGVLKLYKAETASVVVSDGTINNGTGLSVTVHAGPPSVFKFTNCSVNGVAQSCTAAINVGNNPGHFDGHISVFDTWLNTATVTGSSLTVTLSNSNPGAYSVSTNPTIAVGASESGLVTVTHLVNANNSTIVATTNAGFTQASVTVAK